MARQLTRGLRFAQKSLYQTFLMDKSQPQQLLFVFGCQRSGTTMLTGLFRRDLAAHVYTEKGLGRNGDRRILPLQQLGQKFARQSARLLVSKPIVESQRAAEILRYFPSAKAIWMFRNYADVVRSAEKRFSRDAALRNLRAIADPDAQQTFASDNVSAETREIVGRHFSSNMSADDAHALYWYVRNVLFFEQRLDHFDSVMVCGYEDFVADPEQRLRDIYAFVGRDFPGAYLVSAVHSRSVRTRPLEDLSGELEVLCDELQARLESHLG